MDNFIEKTLRDIQRLFVELFQAEVTASQKGLLQGLDPRVKLLSMLGLILMINLARSARELLWYIGYLLLLALLSRIPLLRLLRRVAAIAVIFTGLVALPAIFNWIRPGDPWWHLTDQLYITKQGVLGGVLLVLRSFASLTAVFLLTATTKWVNILKALRIVKVPALFVATLEMAQRYLFLCLELTTQTFTARKSRTLAKIPGREGRRFVATTAGNLLIRTSLMSDAVYQAMLARGYCGEVKVLERFRTRKRDWLWLVWNLIWVVGILQFK